MKKIKLSLFLLSIFCFAFYGIDYPGKKTNQAKASVHFDTEYTLSYYSFYTYNKSKKRIKRKIREDRVSPEGRHISYTTFEYDKQNLLTKEITTSAEEKPISDKLNFYNKNKRKEKSVITYPNGKVSTVKYRYGYRNDELLYIEENRYIGAEKKGLVLDRVIRTTFNLQGLPGKIEYYKVENKDLDEEPKLTHYENISYNSSGYIQHILRLDPNNITRNYIKYQYNREYQLSKILVYEGYVQFLHPGLNYESQFILARKANLLYKLTGKLKALRGNIVFNKSGSSGIEVVFYDYPDEVLDLPRPVVVEASPVKSSESEGDQEDDELDDPTVAKVDRVDRSIKSWSLDINNIFTTKPMYSAEDNLIITTGNQKLISIDPNGKVKWQTEIDSNVIVGPTGYEGVYYLGSEKGTVYAIESGTGRVLWEKGKMGPFISQSAFYVNRKAIFISRRNKRLVVLERLKGQKVLWSFGTDDPILFSPVGNEKFVYVATSFKVYCLRSKDGDDEWDESFDNSIQTQPVITNKLLIIFTTRNVLAVDPKDGSKQKWKLTGASALTTPFIRNNSLYLGTDEGILMSIQIKTGKIDWEKQINLVKIFISGNAKYLFVSHKSDRFILIDYRTGDEITRYEGARNDSIVTPILPQARSSAVYFGSAGNKLYKDTIE